MIISMKKIFLLTYLCLTTVVALSQLSITGKNILISKKDGVGTTKIIMFDSITSSTSIDYTGATNVRFYKYGDINSTTYSTNLFPPEDSTGYVVEVDGVRTDTIWVIDYKKHLPKFTTLEAENNPSVQCENVNLVLNSTIPALTYQSLSGTAYTLPRDFIISYKTSEWKGTAWGSIDSTITFTATTPPQTLISVPAPLQNTTFTITGDQYATQMEITLKPFTGAPYTAVAVKCQLTTAVTDRTKDDNNEADAPSKKLPITYSAPIDVQFQSNANEAAQFYNWEIFKDNILLISRTDKDHRYTFAETGLYKVRLTASNSNCICVDSIMVTVTESAIYAPNVFTPNGDELNDEFRVAYKSIISFDCWVYNRWGRLVYHWTDPTKGWDGNINGRKASPGPYFYVIKALGSDVDPKNPGKRIPYLLKGDINLLRGKDR